MDRTDWYYSKKHDRRYPLRLDFLIYAHDGRGLGHASRGVAVGCALRRLYPDRSTLFISGCKQTSALIGPAPLDWMKLPSYETTVKDGLAEGYDGHCGFYKSVLGRHRRDLIAAAVRTLRPRVVLVDHAPAGKRDELVDALALSAEFDTKWILGIRGVVGTDPDIWSDSAADLFRKWYKGLFWYGDPAVLGDDYPGALARRYGIAPQRLGYVSRAEELSHFLEPEREVLAGTVSITWATAATWQALEALSGALKRIGDAYGPWRFFMSRSDLDRARALLAGLPFCRVEEVSERYLSALWSSMTAVVYGGYNSLTDVLAAGRPALVLRRDISDPEQDNHLDRLLKVAGDRLVSAPEKDADETFFTRALIDHLEKRDKGMLSINMNGAENAARLLNEML